MLVVEQDITHALRDIIQDLFGRMAADDVATEVEALPHGST